MPIHKSLPSALCLTLAISSATSADAAEIEKLTFNEKPAVVECTVLHLCDIELQPGEVITSLKVDDRDRWSVTPVVALSGPDEIRHLVIWPFKAGLKTLAIVETNRRTYNLQLRSDTSRYMPRVQFIYPDLAQSKTDSNTSVPVAREALAAPNSSTPLRGNNDRLQKTGPGQEVANTSALVVREALAAPKSSTPLRGNNDRLQKAGPGQEVANTSAPVSREVWEAPKGSTLRKSVTSWAERAGWDLNWSAQDLDYPIEASLRFEGSFEYAIGQLFPLYDQAARSFQVLGSRAQKLLIITEKPMRIGK